MLAERNPEIDGAATRTRGRASRTTRSGGGPYLTFGWRHDRSRAGVPRAWRQAV